MGLYEWAACLALSLVDGQLNGHPILLKQFDNLVILGRLCGNPIRSHYDG